ncbi:AAA family ATPase [Nocardiopsis sp. HUAS JQ3]|uniref:AAA family ATPase n=1 Tax=Nocardiopsis sp. HUAS JQ3 TaxID=3061629 RepID=UPI0023A981D3|nr:AAA family ATPase [Nocardiopsis sp. HUAS JQ3]WDZ92583.1 AAA family ATPase [Nocardiopsis sp. HUAS JQ3]
MAVLTAIAVIVAALVFAETVLVYVALGLAGVSVLLLLGALLQGRSGVGGRPDRTDGLGKASVPVMAATAASAVPIAHVESENPGRVPAPASEPVREPHVPERPAWPIPAAEDSGHGEPEYDVPRWQTPTAHDWPEPDTAAHDAAPSAPPAGPSPSWASSEQEPQLRAPAPWESGTDTADTAARAEWDEPSGTAAEDGPDTGDTGERTAEASGAAFTYDIPGRVPPADDGSSAEYRSPSGEDDAPREEDDRERGGSAFASEEPFVYSIPRPAQAVEESFPEGGDDDSAGGARDASPFAYDVPGDGNRDGDGEEDGGQAADASDRASFSYDIPGRSATEETVEEDAFADEGDDGDRPDEEETGVFAYDLPGVSTAGDAPSSGDDSRDAVEEDIDDAPAADAPEKRDAGERDAVEPGEDTATAGADGAPESEEASVPAADHDDAPRSPQAHDAERLEEPDEDSGPADDAEHAEDASRAQASDQDPAGPAAEGEDPETAVLPVVSADSEPEEEHAPGGDRDDARTGGSTDEAADDTGDGARSGDEDAADADRSGDEDADRTEDADDDSDGRGGGGAFSYRIPRGADEEDGTRAEDAHADAEPDQEATGEDGSAARADRPADGVGGGPDEDGARGTADRASGDDDADTKR